MTELGGIGSCLFERLKVSRSDRCMFSTPIISSGPNDTLIAAHALALGRVLVSRNLSELERVPGLPLDNWIP